MREIRFRVWNPTIKKMINPVTSMQSSDGNFQGLGSDCVVMQFTGLCDKNGKEIYEGDILRQHKKRGESFVVVWSRDDGQWEIERSFCLSDNLWRWSKVSEVIGNIYENPELVGKGAKP